MKIYSIYARLLEYPWEDLQGLASECVSTLKQCPAYPPKAADEIQAFVDFISDKPLDDIQGIYSYTFEISSGEFTMDMSYHLYDGFRRANNLVTMKAMYRDKGFPYDDESKGELPDNLPVVLRFLDHLEGKDDVLRKDFRETFVVKTLEKLNKNFELKEESETPYIHILRSLLAVVDADVKGQAALDAETKESCNS